MQKRVEIYLILLIGIVSSIQISCKKELPKEIPAILTINVTGITSTSIITGGLICSTGGVPLISRGVCFSTKPIPTISDVKTNNGTETGSFTSTISGLSAGTTYYIRAYATNSIGTGYGNQYIITTNVELSSLTTSPLSAITSITVTSGGNIASDGGATVTARGVCWGTTTGPLVTGSHTTDGGGTGIFISSISGLTAGTLYYVRAYATNSLGTSYGNELTFTTSADVPSLTTTTISLISSSTASTGGNITSDGGATVTNRGVCWSTKTVPTISSSKTMDGSGTGSFISAIAGLSAVTTYYVRAYATNSVGTAYGNEVTFKSSPNSPTLTTNSSSSITSSTASSGGNISSDGGAVVTSRGVCWSIASGPTILNSKTTDGTGTGTFISAITGLAAGTTYFVRAYATNSAGTAYGNEVTFISSPDPPTLTTNIISFILTTTATSGGNISSDGGATVTSRGVCWSNSTSPTTADSKTNDGTGIGSFTSFISVLTAGTTYYLRAYATNSAGTAYGNEVSFTSLSNCGTVTDIDGNVYNTITIGTQCWLAENLKTTKYNDGTLISNVTDDTAWAALSSGAYSWYNNDLNNKDTYGALYNWYTIPSEKLCPTGWHVPSDTEWTTLITLLGGVERAASIAMKSVTGWSSPNEATNSSGFTALPGGIRYDSPTYYGSTFFNLTYYGYWWSSTEPSIPTNNAYHVGFVLWTSYNL